MLANCTEEHIITVGEYYPIVIRFKVGHKMEIITFGTGGRLMQCAMLLSDYCPEGIAQRLILLPIPTTRDGIFVTGTDLTLEKMLSDLELGTLVAGYGIPDNIKKEAENAGVFVYDAAYDEDFLKENAIVTAHGALGHILSGFTEDISDLEIGIIGYGRIGSELLRLLLLMGADVRVYTTKPHVAKTLGESGVKCEIVGDYVDWGKNQLIINTAPAKLIDEELLFGELKGIRIIDLASGKIFPELSNITKLPSIPEKMYPETAGRIYAKYVKRALSEVGK